MRKHIQGSTPVIPSFVWDSGLKLLGEVSGARRVQPRAVVIDFLSNRIAHISEITYPLPE